jgi:FHS family L-fucose permease-like MFS transporter
VAFALFGSSASVTDEMIAKLDLIKVIILYAIVGLLFISAAAIFGLSKAVPSGIIEEKIEPSGKALRSLIIMTGLLVIIFVPVFSSYNSKEAKKIVEIEKSISPISDKIKELTKQIDIAEKADKLDKTWYNKTIQEKASLEKQLEPSNKQIKKLKDPLEKTRAAWLFGALLVVVGSLLLTNMKASKNAEGWGAMRYPQLVLGMLAIFIYVGVEVAIGSNLGELLKQKEFGGFEASEIAPFISMYWGSLMIGRWTGAVSAFNLNKSTKSILIIIVPLVAFGIILACNLLAQKDISSLYWYVLCVLVQVAAFFYVGENPIKSLIVFGSLGVVAMILGMTLTGQWAVYAFLSGGLFCSILWPCIFSLSIAGLGKYTSQGSAFLIMMILGGGIIPPIQGKLADLIGIQFSYVISVACFIYLVFFAIRTRKILKKQGVEFELSSSSGGH